MSNGGNKQKTFVVIGLGRFGAALGIQLVKLGMNVLGIDKSRLRVEELSDQLDMVAQLDATDEAALIKAGVHEADIAIVALGDKAEGSIYVTAILRELGVPRIIARANDEFHERILRKVGAHEVVMPESASGKRLAEVLLHPWMSNFSELAESNLIVGKVSPPEYMIGKTVREVAFPQKYHAIIAVIERGDERIVPKGDTLIMEGDKIWIFSDHESIDYLLTHINEELK